MELYLFITAILFWILYYYFEGSHDGAFALETKLMREKLGTIKFNEIEKDFIKFELDWHWYDGLEKALVKIVFSVFVYFITDNLLFAAQMLFLSVGIRSFAHDLFVTIAMGKSLNHIGPDFLWWDRFLRKMHNVGINQYVIKFIPNLIIVLWILWTLE
ncbi:MAG: hypothetical protein COW71_00595 [Ignavibacteriales bacterium CG18_big_fil_WC_8_21_14_2_50_31_20]|nr:MAG: hypothetical protein COW71_00595 [Ignavibacteriales bacterium CG18_big_fil_WC_8_21_14_2_50_31_20]